MLQLQVSPKSLQKLSRELRGSDPSDRTGMKDVGYRAEQAWGMEVEELRKSHRLIEGITAGSSYRLKPLGFLIA